LPGAKPKQGYLKFLVDLWLKESEKKMTRAKTKARRVWKNKKIFLCALGVLAR
jgi:hypothetical protein